MILDNVRSFPKSQDHIGKRFQNRVCVASKDPIQGIHLRWLADVVYWGRELSRFRVMACFYQAKSFSGTRMGLSGVGLILCVLLAPTFLACTG